MYPQWRISFTGVSQVHSTNIPSTIQASGILDSTESSCHFSLGSAPGRPGWFMGLPPDNAVLLNEIQNSIDFRSLRIKHLSILVELLLGWADISRSKHRAPGHEVICYGYTQLSVSGSTGTPSTVPAMVTKFQFTKKMGKSCRRGTETMFRCYMHMYNVHVLVHVHEQYVVASCDETGIHVQVQREERKFSIDHQNSPNIHIGHNTDALCFNNYL